MEPLEALDRILKKSRVHLYKPIQIAEILYRDRTRGDVNLDELETYRNSSKKWRDLVSLRLIGRVSTSSQRFQDNIFEANAMPLELLKKLALRNRRDTGSIEAYIYRCLQAKYDVIARVKQYVENSTPDTFTLAEFEGLFLRNPGLRRSVDKMYEIAVYALFSTLVRALQAEVTVRLGKVKATVIADFEPFLRMVLGLDREVTERTFPASLYRVGATNAADRGLDMWSNFGPAVQVKHLTLTMELIEEIADGIAADRIVIVCRDTEKNAIEALTAQVGLSARIQGILTFGDLEAWYARCLSPRYAESLGKQLLAEVAKEFDAEFPAVTEIAPFLRERGYDRIVLEGELDPAEKAPLLLKEEA